MSGKKRVHCKKGHEYTEENSYVYLDKITGTSVRVCKICKKKQVANWRDKPGIRKKRAEDERLRRQKPDVKKQYFTKKIYRLYKLTEKEYEDKKVQQKGKCAICGRDFGNMPHVDHDHKCCSGVVSCGKCVRSLLCGVCNSGLAFFRDDIESLERAIKYLKAHRKGD